MLAPHKRDETIPIVQYDRHEDRDLPRHPQAKFDSILLRMFRILGAFLFQIEELLLEAQAPHP
jgi:hypothetical protein